MQYLCLIYEAEAVMIKRNEAEKAQIFQNYGDFTQSIVESKQMIGGEALMPTETATSVRVRNDEVLTTDGPFAETKEQLNGYYLINADTLDDAISIASRIPTAKTGTIEVRPIMAIEH